MRLGHLLSKETSGVNNFCKVLWSEQDAKGFRKVSLFNLEGTLSKREAFVSLYGGVAQLGEHLPCKQGVSGSIPLISTNGPIAQLVRAHD